MSVHGFDSEAPVEGPPATSRQVAYLKSLALQSGETFVYPRSVGEASRQIDRLRGRRENDFGARRREERVVRDAVARGSYATEGWD